MKLDPAEIEALARLAESRGGKALGVVAQSGAMAAQCPESTDVDSGHKPLNSRHKPEAEAPGLAPGRHEIVLAGFRPASLNRLMRGKLRDRMRLGREARVAIRAACLAARTPLAWTPRRVSLEITLAPGQRAFDADGPWKCTLDGLVHAGALVDDSATWCQLGDLRFSRGETTSTRIILTDLED